MQAVCGSGERGGGVGEGGRERKKEGGETEGGGEVKGGEGGRKGEEMREGERERR